MDGNSISITVGIEDGIVVKSNEGSPDRGSDGRTLGLVVRGRSDGGFVGIYECLAEGASEAVERAVGTSLAFFRGKSVGVLEGPKVGEALGKSVSMTIGVEVGVCVGIFEGLLV